MPMLSTELKEKLTAEGAVDIASAEKFTGLGRTFLYALMSRGDLKFIKLGKRRLIPRAELNRLLSEHLVGG
jgi:excisionase family DNA binding protein